jgi:hypothetical protein
MPTERLEVGRITFTLDKWEHLPNDVCMVFVEYQEDRWYSDMEVEVDVSREDAEKIVAFLRRAYPNLGKE